MTVLTSSAGAVSLPAATESPWGLIAKHRSGMPRAEQILTCSSAFVIPMEGCLRNLTIEWRASKRAPLFRREKGAAHANIFCSSGLYFGDIALPRGRSVRKILGCEENRCRAPISGGKFLNGSEVGNLRSSWSISFATRFSISPRVLPRDFVRPKPIETSSKFHTSAPDEGRYICASTEEVSISEFWGEFDDVEVSESEITRRSQPLSDNAGLLAERNSHATEILVVNFYHFVSIEDPHFEVARHTSFLRGKDVRGRIYISSQGINAQLSGPHKEASEYAEWVKEDPRFSNMLVQTSSSPVGHTFPRLRLRYKPSLVQVDGGTLHLPVTDPSARAVQLSPREWFERLDAGLASNSLEAVSSVNLEDPSEAHARENSATDKNATRPVILLDVRNGYEWDVGHFDGAQRPDVDCFKSTEFGLAESGTVSSDPLANVSKEAVDVMMYCTGGIRCDVFSTILRQKGFTNLYSLKGGISNYLKEEGAGKWAGNLFVFDSRLAVSPKEYRIKESSSQNVDSENFTDETKVTSTSSAQAFASCRLCGDPIPEPRHRNCANLECNVLYLACDDCLLQQKGCCSQSCSSASKLRPLIVSQQYDRWHNYRPVEPQPPKLPGYVSRRALKRRRRKERRKQSSVRNNSEHLSPSCS